MIRFLTKTFTNYRMEWSEEEEENDVNYFSEREEVGTFKGHLQQATAEMVERYGMNFNTAYSIWCDLNTDVKVGDEITDDDMVFTVRAIKRNETGNFPHLQLAVEGGEIGS